MNSQICLSLQKIIPHSQHVNISKFSLYILTDSGFQHLIQNRAVKNKTINLFGQKIFLPYSTKEILFELTAPNVKSQTQRICGFLYKIQEISINSKKQTIMAWNQSGNEFQLTFSIKLSFQVDTQTIKLTQSQFSQFFPSSLMNKKSMKILCPEEEQDGEIKIQKIYSPVNMSRKLLQLKSEQSWEVKSQQSPIKPRILVKQQDEGFKRKKDTFDTMTLESVSVKKKLLATKQVYGVNDQQQFYLINSNDEDRLDSFDKPPQQGNKHNHDIQQMLIRFRDYIVMGGLFGVFSAIISNEFLIF